MGTTRYEHTAMAERAIGRPLPTGAQVHHVDGNKKNNAPSNLVICQDQAYHRLLHVRAATVRAGGDPNTHKACRDCGSVKPFSDFHRRRLCLSDGLQAICRTCKKARMRAFRLRRRAA